MSRRSLAHFFQSNQFIVCIWDTIVQIADRSLRLSFVIEREFGNSKERRDGRKGPFEQQQKAREHG